MKQALLIILGLITILIVEIASFLLFFPILFPGIALMSEEHVVDEYIYVTMNYNPIKPTVGLVDRNEGEGEGHIMYIIPTTRTGLFTIIADEDNSKACFSDPERNESIATIKSKLRKNDLRGWYDPYNIEKYDFYDKAEKPNLDEIEC